MATDTELTIQQVAESIGLSEHTLRYYERIGLLDPVGRATSGHRRYAAEDIAWLEFLLRLRATGMPIRQMRRYADLRRQGPTTVGERRALLEAHQRQVRQQLAELRANLRIVEAKIAQYKTMEEEINGSEPGTDTL